MNDNSLIYYVYYHVLPETEEIVYIGKGSRGRAWHCAESNSRGERHAEWMNSLIKEGYTPEAWVRIVESSLSEDAALSLEYSLIEKIKPIFNSKRDNCCVLSKEQLIEIKRLREVENLSYSNIAYKIGVSTMTIFRALNKQTKNYVY